MKAILSLLVLAGLARAIAFDCILSDPVTLDEDGLVSLEHNLDVERGIMSMKMTYTGGRSWVGVGINEAGQALMTPATVVIGFGTANETSITEPMVFSVTSKDPSSALNPVARQTLQNSTFLQTDDTSTLTFSQHIDDFGGGNPITDDSQWIYAIGSPNNGPGHPIYGSFRLALAPCSGNDDGNDDTDAKAEAASVFIDEVVHPERSLWIAHGILLAVAWGICSPIAIGTSLVRDGFDRIGLPKETWYQVHLYMNVLTVGLTIIGFILAVVATSNENGAIHWSGKHHKAGLTIFIMAALQAAGGVMRPALPSKPSTTAAANEVGKISNNELTQHTNSDEIVAEQEEPEASTEPTATDKSNLRVGWEWVHRFLGLGVVALAWSNCHSGIDWLVSDFPDLDDTEWTGVFWGVAGGISTFFLAVRFGLHLLSEL